MSAIPTALPAPGDIAGQIASGNDIQSAIMQNVSSTPQALASIGYSLATMIGGKAGAVLTDAIGGASTGLALAGPMGAAIGGLVGGLEGELDALSNQTVLGVFGCSHATEIITSNLQGMASQGQYLGLPQGFAMSEYLSNVRPPKTTRNVAKLLKAALIHWNASTINPGNLSAQAWFKSLPTTWNSIDNGLGTGLEPCCSSLFWAWSDPEGSDLPLCYRFLTQNGGPSPLTPTDLLHAWIASTFASKGLSQAEIVKRALARAPDPLWWAVLLYGQYDSGIGSNVTMFLAPDLANALATTLMYRSAGGSTRGLVTELLSQAWILSKEGQTLSVADNDLVQSGVEQSIILANYSASQALFHAYLDDVLTLALVEDGKLPMSALAGGVPASAGPSTPNPLIPRQDQVHAQASARATVAKFVRMYLG